MRDFSAGISLLLLLGALCAAGSAAAQEGNVEQRLLRLERITESRGLVEMFSRLEEIQRDLQRLRGEMEEQNHSLDELQRRQRDLYVDIDRRLQRLETATAPPSPATGMPSSPSPEPPVTAARSQPPPAPPEAGNDQTAYDHAFDLLKDGRWEDSADAFRRFLGSFPASTLADNAQYWLAETYYKTRQFKVALEEFNKVLRDYPKSAKALDARLKMGYIYYELQDWSLSRQELNEVIRQAPNSTAARLAEDRLKMLQDKI